MNRIRVKPPEALRWEDIDDGEVIDGLVSEDRRLQRACELRMVDPDRAKALVLEYFRTREGPRWLFDFRRDRAREFPTRNYFWGVSITEQDTKEILAYRVRDPNCRAGWHDLGPEVDWSKGGVHSYGSSGWLVNHFWYWGLFAAAGYAMTRDESYARVFERCWRRWQEDYPFVVDPETIAHGGTFSSEHSVMRAGRRILVLTDVLYSGLLGALTDEVAFEVVKYVWFVSGHYLRLPRSTSGRFRYGSGNHNLFDSGVTPYCIGSLWPEFRHSAELVEQGRALIRQHVRSSIHPDGTSVEHSTRYAWYIANMYVQAMEVARLNGDRLLLPAQEHKLRGFLWTLVELSAPGGALIPVGDCQPPPDGLQFHSYRALFADEAVAGRARAFGVDIDRGYAPAAIVMDDRPPHYAKRAVVHYRQSGMVAVRDGVGPGSSLLWVVADPRETTGHGHFDFTSFQVWCNGVPLVLDTPGFSYRIEEVDAAERAYYYSPFGHSLLTVDTMTPVPMEVLGDVRKWWGRAVGDAAVEEVSVRGTAGRIVCSHRSYPGMVVRRTWHFDLAARWIEVEDRVIHDRKDGEKHTYRQLFHLGFGLCPKISGLEAVVEAPGMRACLCFEASTSLRLYCTPTPHTQRTATVFGFGDPHTLVAEAEADGAECVFTCRICWDAARQQSVAIDSGRSQPVCVQVKRYEVAGRC